MLENFPACLKEILRHEGGYVNHKDDAGGATNKGVTQAVYDGYRRSRRLLPRSVAMIDNAEVKDCYKTNYWDKVCGDQLPKGIDLLVFDAAVNSGTGRGEKWLQQAINRVAGARRLREDGDIGFATLDASDDYPADKIIDAYIDLRLGFMKVARNTNTGKLLWPIFGGGWSSRLLGDDLGRGKRADNGVEQVAKRMAADPARTVLTTSADGLSMTATVTTLPLPAKTPLPAAALVRPAPSLLSGLFSWLRAA